MSDERVPTDEDILKTIVSLAEHVALNKKVILLALRSTGYYTEANRLDELDKEWQHTTYARQVNTSVPRAKELLRVLGTTQETPDN